MKTIARARHWFWGLTVVAILAAGVLSRALTADPSSTTGLQVAGSGLALAISGALAARVLLALSRPPKWPDPSVLSAVRHRRQGPGGSG